MKRILTLFIIYIGVVSASFAIKRNDGTFAVTNLSATPIGEQCVVTMQVALDQLHIPANRSFYLTPYVESADGSQVVQLPSLLFNGRNMHYIYLRTGKTKADSEYTIAQEVYHKKGSDAVIYSENTPLQPWMLADDVNVKVLVDTCGCGRSKGNDVAATKTEHFNPAGKMLVMPYPQLTLIEDKIIKHEGRAKVIFEVDKFELHDQVYTYTHRQTHRKHVIDNREQLKIIDDSLHYALSSPNVELASLEICGYASPESPYEHNEYLALNRSRAVVEYVSKHNNISPELCTYSAVPENWAGFRKQTIEATDISDADRANLLELIDRTVHSPLDYDRKETELKTSPKFVSLYNEKIHPDWFPELRYTQFIISTHLKPMTVEQLREIVKTEPQRMSLNHFYKVAMSYERGSDEFVNTLLIALKYYPEDERANANVASLLIERRQYAEAAQYLAKAGDSDEANTLRGIVATATRDFAQARQYFEKAKNSKEAQNNLKLLQND